MGPARPSSLEPSLQRYLTLALTCHELFAATLNGHRPAEHTAMDELLRALGQPPDTDTNTDEDDNDEAAPRRLGH